MNKNMILLLSLCIVSLSIYASKDTNPPPLIDEARLERARERDRRERQAIELLRTSLTIMMPAQTFSDQEIRSGLMAASSSQPLPLERETIMQERLTFYCFNHGITDLAVINREAAYLRRYVNAIDIIAARRVSQSQNILEQQPASKRART